MIYRFGDFELDDDSYTLTQRATARHVEPLIFDLLHFFVRHAGQVVNRDTLMDSVWKGRIVSDTTISGSIKAARKALGDAGNRQQFIQTVRGRGFRFVAPVEIDTPGPTAVDRASLPVSPVSSNALPTLVVLPFDVFQDEGDRSLFTLADSFVENLITVLTRIPLLRITARSPGGDLNRQSGAVTDGHREPGVDFIIEGSLQRLNDQIRINIQLVDGSGGFHLWAQRFDCEQSESLVGSWLNKVVGVLEPQLIRGMMERLRSGGDQLSSKQLLLRAMGLLSLRGWHRDTFLESTELLHRALDEDPELALARAYLALMLGLGHRVGLLERSRSVTADAEREAEHALRLDSFDSTVLSLAGCALADIGQPERAVPILENAISVNPNNGHAWAALGSAETLLQQHPAAIDHLRKGIDISPADSRRAVWGAMLAIAQLQSGDLDAAGAAALEGIRYDHRNYLPRIAHAGISLCRQDRRGAIDALNGAAGVKPDLSLNEVTGMIGTRLGGQLWRLRETAV